MGSLSEEQIEALGAKHGKVAKVEWNGHELVFRRPTRDECRAYRTKLAANDVDASEQLSQQTLVAFDGETDATKARTRYNPGFLDEHPMFASTARCKVALGALMGIVEEADLVDLGKGVSVRPSHRPSTPTA